MIDYTIINSKGGLELSSEQNDIVDELLKNKFYFNCAQTGIGKTLSTVSAAVHQAVRNKSKNYHFVLILPQSAVKAFTDALGKQLGIPYNTYTATMTRTMPNARFHIFNYSTICDNIFSDEGRTNTNNYFEILKKLRSKNKNLWLIADEAHGLQDPKTNQYKFIKGIMPIFSGAWFLTATPILNSLDGFYHMVELLIPGFFGNYYRFRNTYYVLKPKKIWTKKYGKAMCKTVMEPVDFKNMEKLQERFVKISIIRSQFYDFEILYRSVQLPSSFRRFYKNAAMGLFSGTINKKSGKIKKSEQKHAAARLHDLQRVVSNSHPRFKALQDPGKLTSKEVLLINTVKEVLARNEAALIYFGYHESVDRIRYVMQLLQDKLKIPTIHEVTGKISQKKRRAVEDAIQPRDIVLITSAGTESINLQKANNLIFYEIPFPLREFIQACGRITRTNSTYDKFHIYVLEAEGTIDTYKKNRIMSNSIPIKIVVGGSNILPTEILILSEADKQAQKDQLLWWK